MSIAFPANPFNGQEVTFSGQTWTYNSSKGIWEISINFPAAGNNYQFTLQEDLQWFYNTDTGWESNIGRKINLITRDKTQEYTFGVGPIPSVASKPEDELITIHEMDSNFINLKQGILDLEFESHRNYKLIDDRLDTLTSNVSIGFLPSEFSSLGSATSNIYSRLGMTSSSSLYSYFGNQYGSNVVTALNRVKSLTDTNTSNISSLTNTNNSILNSLSSKAAINNPTFTGTPQLTANPSVTNVSTDLATTSYVSSRIDYELQGTTVSVYPNVNNQKYLGLSNRGWKGVFIGDGGLQFTVSGANIGGLPSSGLNWVNDIYLEGYLRGNSTGVSSIGHPDYPIKEIHIGHVENNADFGRILPKLNSDNQPFVDIGAAGTNINEYSTSALRNLFVKDILPADAFSDIGTPGRRFKNVYVETLHALKDTIFIGEAQLSGTELGGVVLPTNTALGTEDNVLSETLIGTTLDQRVAKLSSSIPFSKVFIAEVDISQNDPVHLTPDGTVNVVSSSTDLDSFLGFASQAAFATQNVEVVLHGPVSGFSGFVDETLVYIDENGDLSQTKSATNAKIAVATGTDSLFVFSSHLDTYILNEAKLNAADVSVNTLAGSGGGSLSYDNATATFSYTPADLTSFASTVYVDDKFDELVDSAPGALDTLNELAAALGDDENFSTTVTTNLATKAPINSPTLTGIPLVPTASTSTNTQQVASTAFVKNKIDEIEVGDLLDISITNLQNGQGLVYDSITGVFVNTSNIGGGAANVTFAVDGGNATTAATSLNIFLDGGSA